MKAKLLTERHVTFLVQVKTSYHTTRVLSNNFSVNSSSLFQVSVILVLQPDCTHVCQWQGNYSLQNCDSSTRFTEVTEKLSHLKAPRVALRNHTRRSAKNIFTL